MPKAAISAAAHWKKVRLLDICMILDVTFVLMDHCDYTHWGLWTGGKHSLASVIIAN
jgi:hypothetical protein